MNMESKSGPLTPAEKIRAAGAGDAGANIEDERDLWSGGYSGKAMSSSFFLGALVSIALLVVGLLFLPTALGFMVALGVVSIFVALIWVGLGGMYLFRRWSRGYEVTTQRLKHRNGILTRVSDRIELIDVDDVTVRQGPVQAIFGVGNIRIRSSDTSHPELTLIGIDQCRQVADLIDDARRQERRKRGLHIEAI